MFEKGLADACDQLFVGRSGDRLMFPFEISQTRRRSSSSSRCERDSGSPILINIEMTRPDAATAYSVWYAFKSPEPGPIEIVYIGVVRSEFTFVAPGKGEGTHFFEFHLLGQDLDPEDGFPDEGETPACVAPVPINTFDTRLPAP